MEKIDKTYKKITLLPGDGIGPEIMEQAEKVMKVVTAKYGYTFEFTRGLIGAVAIDKTEMPLPPDTLDMCLDSDAVLLACVGRPDFDNDPTLKVRPEQGLLGLRKALDLFINIRPIKIYKSLSHLSVLKKSRLVNVDMEIYRELSSGIYFGKKQEADKNGYAFDQCSYYRSEIERIAIPAFEKARIRNKKLCLVDKANVLASSRLWRKTVDDISINFPDVKLDRLFVDNAAMQMVQNPGQFDVILTSNMFGDILSDLASVLGGSIGLLPSSSIGTKCSMYEPVHGSYPSATGKNTANPIAMILSVKMMLEDFGMLNAAEDVEKAVNDCIESGVGTEDIFPDNAKSCSDMGDVIAHFISESSSKGGEKNRGSSISTII